MALLLYVMSNLALEKRLDSLRRLVVLLLLRDSGGHHDLCGRRTGWLTVAANSKSNDSSSSAEAAAIAASRRDVLALAASRSRARATGGLPPRWDRARAACLRHSRGRRSQHKRHNAALKRFLSIRTLSNRGACELTNAAMDLQVGCNLRSGQLQFPLDTQCPATRTCMLQCSRRLDFHCISPKLIQNVRGQSCAAPKDKANETT
jgi:hypothetical protein